jgi:hypothetical protein
MDESSDNESRAVTGACLCGAVRFEVALPTLFCAHCHCTMCRRAHGAAYVTWIGVPRLQFRIQTGGTELVRYPSSKHGQRSFCRVCGSSLFCESSMHPDRIDVVLANMEGPVDRAPQAHVYFDDRAEWVVVDDGLPQLGGDSGMEPR